VTPLFPSDELDRFNAKLGEVAPTASECQPDFIGLTTAAERTSSRLAELLAALFAGEIDFAHTHSEIGGFDGARVSVDEAFRGLNTIGKLRKGLPADGGPPIASRQQCSLRAENTRLWFYPTETCSAAHADGPCLFGRTHQLCSEGRRLKHSKGAVVRPTTTCKERIQVEPSTTEQKKSLTSAAQLVPSPALDTGAIVLREDQLARVRDKVSALEFDAIATGDVVRIGLDAEQALQNTLDGFLTRLDRNSSAKLFDLFGQLEKGVDDAGLPEMLERLHEGEKPGFLKGMFARFTGKSPDELFREFMDEVGALISSRTQTLADHMQRLEEDLAGEMQTLFAELKTLDTLKQAYAAHFDDFTFAAATAKAFHEKAAAFVIAERAKAQPGDVVAQSRLRELDDKLRLLESRALALEGTYTRLPADQMVIQQIELAGVATLQETATTVASRFASIKMTLLSIHGAFAVMSVQQLSQRQARMDDQLAKIRAATLKDVAVTAAEAPGDNRLAQAKQIESIVATTKEIHGLIETAKRQTDEKFSVARQKFLEARRELSSLA
jgi:hypothetical protein